MSSKPVQNIRCGGVQIAVWENDTEKGKMRSITIDKSYKTGAEWKRTKSFKMQDLPKIRMGLQEVLKTEYLKVDSVPETIVPETKDDFE